MLKFSFKLIFLLLLENFIINISVLSVTALTSYEDFLTLYLSENLLLKALLLSVIYQLCLYCNDFYDFKITNNSITILIKIFQSLGVSAIILATIYKVNPYLLIDKNICLISACVIVLLIFSWRSLYAFLLGLNKFKENILIIGSGKIAIKIAKEILSDVSSGINIVGFISKDTKKKGLTLACSSCNDEFNSDLLSDENEKVQSTGKAIFKIKVLGTYNELLGIVKSNNIDRIVIALNEKRGIFPVNVLMDCKFSGVNIVDAISFYERISGKILLDNLNPSWLIFSNGFKRQRKFKRIRGIIFSLLGIILSSPVMLITVIAIKLESKGPVLYRQVRAGLNGKEFTLLKFRSMYADAETQTGSTWAAKDDKRITKVGKFIRIARIDEIPQFFNLLKGDMNFVGPRPERPVFINKLNKELPYYRYRLSIKPGITGWAQIKHQYSNSIEESLEKLKYDLFYIKNSSLLLDIFIIFETIRVVLLGRGAK